MLTFASFEKLKPDWNQICVIDAAWEPSLVDKGKGHIQDKGHLMSILKMRI